MAAEACRMQDAIVWGTGCDLTVEVELDCSVFGKWKEIDAETGKRWYHYYVYMGARQRGDLTKFALLPVGVSTSEDEGRVKPESEEAYHAFCRHVFGSQRPGLISMTDGAHAYRCRCEECSVWFVEHHWVNHSRKPRAEFTRSQPVLANRTTLETRAGMAGTMTIDAEWGFLKAFLPKGCGARTPEARERLDMRVRAQQFRRMTSTGDRWAAFCSAARRWIEKCGTVGTSQKSAPVGPQTNISAVLADQQQKPEGPALSPAEREALTEALVAEPQGSGAPSECDRSSAEAFLAAPPQENEQAADLLEQVMEQLMPGELNKLEEACRRARAAMAAMPLWQPPKASIAPLPQDVAMVQEEPPRWYNSCDTEATTHGGLQAGETCGLHAVNHLLFADAEAGGCSWAALSKSKLEAVALETRLGDAQHHLFNEGGSCYDIGVLTANCTRLGLSLFPLTPMDIEGSDGKMSMTAGGRLQNPFGDFVLHEGCYRVVGYLLRLPSHGGHWVSILPASACEPLADSRAGILCDSLYKRPFGLYAEQLEQLLQACALQQAHGHGHACFLAGRHREV